MKMIIAGPARGEKGGTSAPAKVAGARRLAREAIDAMLTCANSRLLKSQQQAAQKNSKKVT
jgi:hypothetical protein